MSRRKSKHFRAFMLIRRFLGSVSCGEPWNYGSYGRVVVHTLCKKDLGRKTDKYLSERACAVSADRGKHNIRQSLWTEQLLMRHFIISLFSSVLCFCSASLNSELRKSADEMIIDEFLIRYIKIINCIE